GRQAVRPPKRRGHRRQRHPLVDRCASRSSICRMKQTHCLFTIVVVLLSIGCSRPKDAASVVADAQQAMGNPQAIQYAGAGMDAFFGQALTAGQEWPRRDLAACTRTIDYDRRASKEEMSFAQAVFGGQQQNAQVVGDKAWNVGANGPAPQPAAAE